ncbi:hypothetical protein Tco_0615381 [Tanacetum coccineum]
MTPNSWSRRIQQSNLGLASCLARRYLRAEWSVKTIVFDKTRYGRCDNHDLSRLVKPLVLTYESVAIYGVCDYMCLYAFMWIIWEIGSQSIECDHLNEIGMVIEVMVALDISLCSHFSDNENNDGDTRDGILKKEQKCPINLGPERPSVYSELSQRRKDRIGLLTKEEWITTQHEAHANENKMMLERLTQQTVDPLALMSNVSHQPYHSQSYESTTHISNPSGDTSQSDLGNFSNEKPNRENQLKHLPYSPSHTKLSFLKQTINSEPLPTQGIKLRARGAGAVGYGRAQNRVGNANPGQASRLMVHYQDAVCDIRRNTDAMTNALLGFELMNGETRLMRKRRIVICDLSIKEEENLNKELHSIKLQLASTIQHNKLMVDEVTSLKKDFNQKENKFLEEFLDLKALKISRE